MAKSSFSELPTSVDGTPIKNIPNQPKILQSTPAPVRPKFRARLKTGKQAVPYPRSRNRRGPCHARVRRKSLLSLLRNKRQTSVPARTVHLPRKMMHMPLLLLPASRRQVHLGPQNRSSSQSSPINSRSSEFVLQSLAYWCIADSIYRNFKKWNKRPKEWWLSRSDVARQVQNEALITRYERLWADLYPGE